MWIFISWGFFEEQVGWCMTKFKFMYDSSGLEFNSVSVNTGTVALQEECYPWKDS